MRRSGQLRHPPQIARRQSRQLLWEEENVSELAYADEGEWQAEAEWPDADEPSSYPEQDELAEDASQYAELDDYRVPLSAQADAAGIDASDDAGAYLPEEEQWDQEPDAEDAVPEERGLVAFHGRQAGALRGRSGELGEYALEPYRFKPGALAPVFIAGNGRKAPKIGALGHAPVALRAHRPRPFFFHTVALAIVVFSLIVSALTVGALIWPRFFGQLAQFSRDAARPRRRSSFTITPCTLATRQEGSASRFGVKFGGILELNGLIDGEQIYVGMNLKVPSNPTYGAAFHALLNLPYAPDITPSPRMAATLPRQDSLYHQLWRD